MMFPHFDFEKDSSAIYYVLAIMASLFTLVKLSLHHIYKFFLGISERYHKWDSAINSIESIRNEFKPNHGSSLKDQINKMQGDLSRNTELTEKISTRQKWIFDNQELAIFESDEQGLCVWVNTAYVNLVKRESSFILGHGWKNIIAPEDRERVSKNWQLCVSDGRDSEDSYSIIDSAGKRIRVSSSICKTGKYGYVGAIKTLDK